MRVVVHQRHVTANCGEIIEIDPVHPSTLVITPHVTGHDTGQVTVTWLEAVHEHDD